MLVLTFRFLAGRYHATPWGAHVNEGLVEWPPSPWRVLRAMIAVGFSRLGWSEVPESAARLLNKLGSELPTLHIPPASAAHTRHYMPIKGNTTKVLDTFAYVGDGELAIAWDVDLTTAEHSLVSELAEAMPYLGRAESWVECHVADKIPAGLRACLASEACPGPGLERVSLLAPDDGYDRWRADAVERERAVVLEALQAKAKEKAKAPPKSLPKKELEKIDALFPATLIDALRVDTGILRDQGWSQPPGSRWVAYWRPAAALGTAPRPQVIRRSKIRPTTALFALASDTQNAELLPPMRDALWRMEAIHDALVRLSDSEGHEPSEVFTGKRDGELLKGHMHATLIPLTLGRRADRIDHIMIHAPMGFDERARTALSNLRRTWAKDLPTIFVTLVGVGTPIDFVKVVPHVGRSTTWVSSTPFVPPRHPKPRGTNTIEGQIRAEIVARGLPEPRAVELLDRRAEFRWFRRARRHADRAPAVAMSLGMRLHFAEPISGPLAIGYASHYGLGNLVPETTA